MSDKQPPKSKKNEPRKKYIKPVLLLVGTLSVSALSAQAGVSSSRLVKKDVKALSPRDYTRMLSKLNTLKLYRYRYLSEDKTKNPHMGVIAEEAPIEITDRHRMTIDVVSTLGLIMAGIKAQEERRRHLESEVAKQKRQIQFLNQLIKTR